MRITRDGSKTVTSVYIPVWTFEWMREHKYGQSEFIRGAIEERIKRLTGFSTNIEKLEEDIKFGEERLIQMKKQLAELKQKQKAWDAEQKVKEADEIITRALLRVHYSSVDEAAHDLRTMIDLPMDKLRELIKKKDEELKGKIV